MSSQKHTHAFATTFAVFMIALVGAAMLAVTTLMTTDVRRTTRQAVDAQLRQFLHAGAVKAIEHLRMGAGVSADSLSIKLPATVGAGGGALDLMFVPLQDGQTVEVRIEARFADRRMFQILTLARENDRWNVRSIVLD